MLQIKDFGAQSHFIQRKGSHFYYVPARSPATHFAVSDTEMKATAGCHGGLSFALTVTGRAPASGGEVAQHVLQDAAVLEVFQLVESIDAANQRHALERAVAGDDLGDHALVRLEVAM
jgi:hypothetical protein